MVSLHQPEMSHGLQRQDKRGEVEYAVFMSHFESVLGQGNLEIVSQGA